MAWVFSSLQTQNALDLLNLVQIGQLSKTTLCKQNFGLGFPTVRDRTTFRDNGTEVSSLSRDKGTTGKAQNLAKGRDGPGQLKSGPGRARTAKIQDGTRDKTGQSRKRMF